MLRHRALYAAFDRFPTRKGAAVHINYFSRTLFEHAGGGLLYVLGDDLLPPYQREGSVEIVRFEQSIPNRLARGLAYGDGLARLIDGQADTLDLAHFRDPWSGVPLLARTNRRYRTVYEINGLPSIELPAAFPHLPRSTRAKLRRSEAFCWSRADRIVTPSYTLRDNLVRLGAPAERITVIPNGAVLPPEVPPPVDAPSRYVLYFGAVQPWQGVDVLLRAFALLSDLSDLRLVVCVSTRPRHTKPYRRLARRLGLSDRIVWRYRLSEAELLPWRRHALVSVAPLVECARNVEQGCSPLKILESMAVGVPVVASDLPVVRELIADGEHGRLVPPGRPSELARTLRLLLEDSEERARLGHQARLRVADRFTWEAATRRLTALYADLSVPAAA